VFLGGHAEHNTFGAGRRILLQALNAVGVEVHRRGPGHTTAFTWLLNAEWLGHTMQIRVAVLLWIAVPLAVGLVRTVQREIN
jgi:hypothetical protein